MKKKGLYIGKKTIIMYLIRYIVKILNMLACFICALHMLLRCARRSFPVVLGVFLDLCNGDLAVIIAISVYFEEHCLDTLHEFWVHFHIEGGLELFESGLELCQRDVSVPFEFSLDGILDPFALLWGQFMHLKKSIVHFWAVFSSHYAVPLFLGNLHIVVKVGIGEGGLNQLPFIISDGLASLFLPSSETIVHLLDSDVSIFLELGLNPFLGFFPLWEFLDLHEGLHDWRFLVGPAV